MRRSPPFRPLHQSPLLRHAPRRRCHRRSSAPLARPGRRSLRPVRPLPSFRESVPYVVALVDLEEGARIPTNLVDVPADREHVSVGMPVEVTFDDVTGEITLPKFKPAS